MPRRGSDLPGGAIHDINQNAISTRKPVFSPRPSEFRGNWRQVSC
jgi:hypothetical protein